MARLQKLQVTILASEWGSSNGVLSTTIREFAIQLAKHDCVNVNLFMPKCSETDKKAAPKYGISIFTANRLIAFDELDWLSYPPDNLRMDVVVGHGVELGRQAQIICNLRKCKWVQVVHSDPEFERNRNMDLVDLCKMADFVVAAGPKLTEAFRKYLSRCKTYEDVFDFTPGVFADFACVQHVRYNREYCSILVFGRGDAEDYELKDFDIVGRSVADLPDTHLIFIGAHKTEKMTETHFENLSIPSNRRIVKPHFDSQDYLEQLFCQADLLLMPSRTEGFGMMSLMALSAGLPVIVSKSSGFGEALKNIPFGSMFFIDSEDYSRWKMAIEDVWKKDRKLRLLEIEEVRRYYDQRYSWSQQCKWLIEKMFKLCDGTSSESEVTEETEAMELKLNYDFTGSSSEPETTAEGVEAKKRKRKKNFTGSSSEPETTAEGVEPKTRKRKKNFTGHSLRVPSKRKNGIQKKETAQVHERQQTFLKRWLQRKPKSQFLVLERRMKKGMMLTREKSAKKKKKKNINSRSMEGQRRKKKKKIGKVSKPLEDLVNDASDSLDKICKRLDTPLAGLGSYEDVAKYYDYDVFTVQSRFKTSPDGPSKAMISSIIAEHPDVTIESFAKVIVKQTRRENVARLLRKFDCK